MDNACTVDVLQPPKDLVDQKLHMIIGQPLCSNNIVEIGAH